MKAIIQILLLAVLGLGACTVTKKVKDGDTAYQLKQYAVAVELLEKEYKSSKVPEERFRKAHYLGKSYDILQDYPAAVRWFEKASRHQESRNSSENLAKAYKKNERYQAAYDIYYKLYKETSELQLGQEVELCRRAMQARTDSKDFNITTFSVNSKYGEYSPVYLDDDHIVFTSDRETSTGGETYKWTGNSFSDLFVSNLQGRKVNNFDAILNTGANEGTACFSQDRNEIFFTRCESIDLRNQHCRIYYSQRPNGFWMEAEPLLFFGEETNFAHPCLIENDSVLIFSASPASSDGTYDLYYSERVEGGWTEPGLMPSKINSIGNEKFPTANKDTLFFSSDALPGYGGLDIFKTYLRGDGSWSIPENMGLPINSGADDFGLAVDPRYQADPNVVLQGYLSSSRNVGTGDDIFFFSQYKSTTEKETDDESTEEPVALNMYLSIRVVEVLHNGDDPNDEIIGKEPLSGSALTITHLGKETKKRTDESGRYIMDVEPRSTYELTAAYPGYIATAKTISTVWQHNAKKDTTINVEVALEKIQYDKEIVLQSIYYDYEKWNIRKDAKPSLDSLNTLLQLNPTLKIELSSHTDCRGEENYNLSLSQRRAQSAVDYLIGLGIDKERLSARGYGESRAAVYCACENCTEDDHQRNRRTAFKILE